MIEVPWHRELSDSRYYRPNFQIYIHIRKTFSDLILSSVLGAGIDENVKGLTVNCSCFILFLPRKKFFSNFFLPSLLFLSETFDSKRVNLGHRLTPFSHFVCLEHKYLPEITYSQSHFLFCYQQFKEFLIDIIVLGRPIRESKLLWFDKVPLIFLCHAVDNIDQMIQIFLSRSLQEKQQQSQNRKRTFRNPAR